MVRIKPRFLKPVNTFQMQDTSSNVSTSQPFFKFLIICPPLSPPPIPLKGLVKIANDYPHVKKYGKLDTFHLKYLLTNMQLITFQYKIHLH